MRPRHNPYDWIDHQGTAALGSAGDDFLGWHHSPNSNFSVPSLRFPVVRTAIAGPRRLRRAASGVLLLLLALA